MTLISIQRTAAFALISGSLLLAAYAAAFPALLPMDRMSSDFSQLVRSPHWSWIASSAFAGVVLSAAGFAGVYSRLWDTSGVPGFMGFLFLEAAYLLQACKVTWEIFLYPLIARHPAAVVLLRDGLIRDSALVGWFRLGATLTIFAGTLLFCFTLVRSRAFPKSAGVLVFAGALIYGIHLSTASAIAGILIHALGCLVLGLRLMRPPPVTASA